MAGTLREELSLDLESCRILDRETTQAIRDARYLRSGGTIHVAVDFSEIYSLVFPQDSHDEMQLFFDDTADDALLLQHDALSRIFFRREPVLLHPAHAIEFQTFIIKLRSGLFVETIEKLKDAANEWSAALEHPDAARLRAHGTSVETLSDEELEAAVQFCEQNLASVLLLADPRSTQPLRVVNRLLRERRFAEPDVFAHANGSSHIKKRWQDRLLRDRGPAREGASMIDALVMAAVHHANQQLAPSGRIHLITRSPHMLQIFAEEHAAGFWNDAGGDILRHPRVFSVLYADEREEPAERLKQLEQRRASLRLLIRSAELHLNEESAAFDAAGAQRVREAIRALRDDWRLLPKMDLLSGDPLESAPMAGPAGTSRNATARELLRIFAEGGRVSDLVQRRLGELVSGIDRQQEFIGWLLQSNRLGERRQIEALWVERSAGNSTILMSRRHSMPYTLEFYSPEVQEWATGFEAGRDILWDALVNFFSEGLRDQNYERLLAMAYVLGSLDKWELAEDYCRQAVRVAQDESISAHEALFFLAICLRKHEPNAKRHREAIEVLGEAAALRAARGAPLPDPRYLREKALHLLDLHRNAPDADATAGVSARREALALLQQALTATTDPSLEIQLLNSISYYYCVDEWQPELLQTLLNRLMAQLRLREANEEHWPPLVVDTIAWATHLLRMDEPTRQEARMRLQRALKSDDLREPDRRIMQAHLRAMRAPTSSVGSSTTENLPIRTAPPPSPIQPS